MLRIAIVGAGISGNLAARLLATRHEVRLFEASNYAGGHTHTVDVPTADGPVPVDTGFMVFNRRTYPNFCRMLELLEVESQPTDMSFSVQCKLTGLEYSGSTINGLLAQRGNLLRPRFYRLIRDILRFNRAGEAQVANEAAGADMTLGDFLSRHRLGSEVRQWYLIPLLAAIWSAAPTSVESLPARFILGFMHNHGLMKIHDRPQWRTITGGAKRYVEKLLAPLANCVQLATPASRIERHRQGVTVCTAAGTKDHFDAVVLATHADQSLELIADPTKPEREILRAFPYQTNMAVLHADSTQMPRRRRAWASWNYQIPARPAGAPISPKTASVTYHLNRLQKLPTADPVFVTLNPTTTIAPEKVYRAIAYQHPAYSLQSVAGQQRWREINGQQHTWYCGAYWGYGFHEDGVNSALRVAADFGLTIDALADSPLATNANRREPHRDKLAVTS